MISSHTVFVAVLGIALASGTAAVALAAFGDTRRNEGQRQVALRLAQVTVICAAALASLLLKMLGIEA